MESIRNMRARETFNYHDTVLVGLQASNEARGWYDSYIDLGAANEINFFNVRSRSVGDMYCNLDAPGQMPVGYLIESLGVEFKPPFQQPGYLFEDPPDPTLYTAHPTGPQHFMELIYHSSIKLYIGQDEKLSATCARMPAGYGSTGMVRDIDKPADFAAKFMNCGIYNNGVPDQGSRWNFADPIEVPRNAVIRAKLEFSDLGKKRLQQLPGPEWNEASTVSGCIYYMARSLIRVSIGGTRIVQLRNSKEF